MSASSLSHLKRLIPALVVLSAVSSLAVLVNPIFMMQVLDRVLPTGNLNTLMLLLVVAAAALLVQAVIEGLRDLSLQYAAHWSERAALPLILNAPAEARATALEDLAEVKNLLGGPNASALLSAPWLPLFVAVLWLIHPGFVALAAVLVLLGAGVNAVSQLLISAQSPQFERQKTREHAALANVQALPKSPATAGLSGHLITRLIKAMGARSLAEDRQVPITASASAAGTYIRSLTQLLGLSVGATLVVYDALSAGGMIAASLILSKTVLSCESALRAWPQFLVARQAFARLHNLPPPPQQEGTTIPALSGALRCEQLVFPKGGGAPPRLDRISFELPAGSCLAIVGASGSGKTTLLEALSGSAPCPIGAVWLEDTEVKTLPAASRTLHLGYLPQQAQLYRGTLAENIASFAPNAADDMVIEAAKTAGVHGLISALPDSYDTDIGHMPSVLSAGQKQRVALARAIFHHPKYLFLDEPNALLDAAGERQLCAVLARLKKQGTTIVMVIHRSGIMGLADYVLALEHGRMADFGPRAEVLGRMSGGRRRIDVPLRQDSLQDLTDWLGAQFTRSNDAPLSSRAELIATELFNLTCASGPRDLPRTATFAFRFLSEQSCELTATENRTTEAGAKIEKVTRLLRLPNADVGNLPGDEAALAVISQISDSFEIENISGQAVYRAAVSMRPVVLQGSVRH